RGHSVCASVVARAIGSVEHLHRIAGTPDELVRGVVIAPGHPHGAAASLPGVVLIFPGLAAGLAGGRDHVFAPEDLSGGGVERGGPVAHAAIPTGGAREDLSLE